MSLNELTGYACGHFATVLLAGGLAVYLAQTMKDYFSNPERGFIDETMAGACNGFQMACPNCKKTKCWDPLPQAEQQPVIEAKKPKKKQSTTSTEPKAADVVVISPKSLEIFNS